MFFSAKTVEQVAALPFVPAGDGFELLLVTSRRRGRWIVPKGWPVKDKPLHESAKLEAKEEAGVIGTALDEPLGQYTYQKRMSKGYEVRCRVYVYPILVTQHRVRWRERTQRTLRWCPLHEAAEMVDDNELAKVIRELIASDCAFLRERFPSELRDHQAA